MHSASRMKMNPIVLHAEPPHCFGQMHDKQIAYREYPVESYTYPSLTHAILSRLHKSQI